MNYINSFDILKDYFYTNHVILLLSQIFNVTIKNNNFPVVDYSCLFQHNDVSVNLYTFFHYLCTLEKRDLVSCCFDIFFILLFNIFITVSYIKYLIRIFIFVIEISALIYYFDKFITCLK